MAKPNLSPRELQVLHMIMDEMTSREIANDLSISPRTVETHRKNMIRKTGARNFYGVVRTAIGRKWIRV